ncbi:MAG: helix-turn-helix domain-containing protein, partial [Betaproteobacteria bacterium]|nr:helix-turn-helix domain-containing protein [Betaproteobacteria bacterium]
VRRGESLYRAGERFSAIYAIRTGFFKSNVIMEDGRDQVTGFHMPGDIVGMDGIGSERHSSNIVALEDGEVCTIPFSRIEEILNEVRGFQRQFHRMMSREILRDQGVMMLLGSLCAEERIAVFLLNLSQRFMARGYSPSEFHLRMTREEIGSFLGLKLETVSRIFRKFQQEKLISVHLKRICILDMDGLQSALSRDTGTRARATLAQRCASSTFCIG